VSFAAITLCVASQRVFMVVGVNFVMTQSGNFWINPHICHKPFPEILDCSFLDVA
jgi:hypothetical protein